MSKSIVTLANEKVPFPLAAQWAGVEVYGGATERGTKVHCPFGRVEHPDGGLEAAMRVYPDHGYCFAEGRYFSSVSLLAEVWQLSRKEAAEEALSRTGYKPVPYDERFALAAGAKPDPDPDALAAALLTWCEARVPGWKLLQVTDPGIARQLARCLGLLPLVHDEAECDIWLAAAKKAMARVLTAVN